MTIPNGPPEGETFVSELHRVLGLLRDVLEQTSPGAPLPEELFREVESTVDRLGHVLGSTNGNGLPRWLLSCEACGEEVDTFDELKRHRLREHDLRALPPQIKASTSGRFR